MGTRGYHMVAKIVVAAIVHGLRQLSVYCAMAKLLIIIGSMETYNATHVGAVALLVPLTINKDSVLIS